jgi:hypothetical protein
MAQNSRAHNAVMQRVRGEDKLFSPRTLCIVPAVIFFVSVHWCVDDDVYTYVSNKGGGMKRRPES